MLCTTTHVPFFPILHVQKVGAIVFDRMDGFEYNYYTTNNTDSDNFLNAWRKQGPENVQRLNGLVPKGWLVRLASVRQLVAELKSERLGSRLSVKLS